jgi:sugar phosphate isomerase/epimerase
MNKISTEIWSTTKHVGEEKAIEILAKAGFDGWDFSMFEMARIDWSTMSLIDNPHPLNSPDYVKFAKRLKKVADDNGIVCNQGHAPFPSLVVGDDYLKRSIECMGIVGGDILVIHPDNNSTPEQNAEMYHRLLPFAKEHGVRIATENMWNWENGADHASFAACATPEDFCKHIDIINDKSFVACLDLGHAEMRGIGTNAPEMIRALGYDRLKALHIHDNDLVGDSHQIPFSMNMDFEAIAKALKEIGYDGYLTLEADRYLSKFDKDTVEKGVQDLANSARRLGELMEK